MIKKDLFLATLSLDAYNQGVGERIEHGETNIGGAIVTFQSDTAANSEEVAVGFYAVAYDVPGGRVDRLSDSIVISYRGTDDTGVFSPTSDIWSGWITATGALGPQARLAAEFYHSVKAANPGKHIILTGHSLGGGLAGLMAGLHGEEAVIFDNMPFEQAAKNAYELATLTDADIDALATNEADQMGAIFETPYDVLYNSAKQRLEDARVNVRKIFYNIDNNQDDIPAINNASISGNFVTGEVLEFVRNATYQETTVNALDSHGTDTLGVGDLHTLGVLNILRFAADNDHTDWHTIGEEFWGSFFDQDVGKAAGFPALGTDGLYDETSKLIASVAYSALDGSENLVFGNTGIRALFDDANELGRLVANNQLPGFLTDNVDDFADLIVQFAGQMALQKVDYLNLTGDDADFAPEQGILSFFKDGVAVANDNNPLSMRMAA